MTIDADLVTRKMVLVARELDGLATIRDRGLEAYRQSRIDQAVAERHLERMIGRMIDINYHLITGSGEAPPTDYYASFVQLGAIGALDAGFARAIASSAGLRNRIVHEYDDLDHDQVFEALVSASRDIPRYLAAIDDYLQRVCGITGPR